jgi:hypothetical protein
VASRVPRRGTARSKESAAPTAVSEHSVSGQGTPGQLGEDQIARLAYSYWEARGGGGSAEEDWYRAEQELLALSRAVNRR